MDTGGAPYLAGSKFMISRYQFYQIFLAFMTSLWAYWCPPVRKGKQTRSHRALKVPSARRASQREGREAATKVSGVSGWARPFGMSSRVVYTPAIQFHAPCNRRL